MDRITIIILFMLVSLKLIAQDWAVPEDKRGKLSPFMFDDVTRKAGERLYTINCISCHGTPGKGNFLNLVPPPGDPATDKIQHNSDGEIFYKVTNGRGLMPSFKNTLSSNDIWNLISFLRSFNIKYVQAVMPVIKSAAYPGAVIGISFNLTPAKDKVLVKVTASGEKSIVPVINAGVKIFVKRTFGSLLLDEEKTTNPEGIAAFKIPGGLPGDTAGNVYLSARLINEELFGVVSSDTVLQAGIITIPQSLIKNRAMWNTEKKAPVWIILTYGLGVIVVWCFILLVLFKLRDISVIGKYLSSSRDEEK
jgi:hypothetical protein